MKKILVIEDDYSIRSSLRELLEENKYEVFCASDGTEGLHLARQITPDLIICDIMMPKLDGYEVLEKLKTEPAFTTTPFIYLTAKTEIFEMRSGMEKGADDYIAKPYRAANLLKAVEIRLERFHAIHEQKINPASEVVETIKNRLSENDRIFINVKNKMNLIRIGDILWIKAEGEYSTIFTLQGARMLVRKSMKAWESELPENIFLRIHRATIVNLSYINKVEKWSNRSLMIFLSHTDEKFVVSQRYTQKIKSNLVV